MAKKKSEDKSGESVENTKNDGEFSSNEDEPNFSDPEGYVDDISDEGNYIRTQSCLSIHVSKFFLSRLFFFFGFRPFWNIMVCILFVTPLKFGQYI